MNHFIEVCEFGVVHAQCRCPGPRYDRPVKCITPQLCEALKSSDKVQVVEPMARKRVKLEVYVDLDPIPGTFHSIDSARNVLANILDIHVKHYNPTVSVGTNESNRND